MRGTHSNSSHVMYSRYVITKRWILNGCCVLWCFLCWSTLSTAYTCIIRYPLANVWAVRVNRERGVGWSSGIGGFLRFEHVMSGCGTEYDCGYGRVVPDEITPDSPLNVRIAGGGIGGLVAAKYMKQFGINVVVHEKAEKFEMFGGPIQLASNALSAIKAMDPGLFDRVMCNFTFTAARVNGIKDGIQNEWYSKFDAITHVANELSLPYTGVISRPNLHKILLEYLTDDEVLRSDAVVGYEHTENGAKVKMQNGNINMADVLIGADGIWSNIRAQMYNEPAKSSKGKKHGTVSYTGVTVFAGQAVFCPDDYWEVGYKVYVGPGQYFVTSDVGQGIVQWYAFIALPEGTEIHKGERVAFLREHFASWSHEIHSLLNSTYEGDIDQRDMYDCIPSISRLFKTWSEGHITLLGDSCHAMMPSLGQGGCQAIEDAYVLTNILKNTRRRSELPAALQSYYKQRIIRTTAVQYLSRASSDLLRFFYSTPASIQFHPFRIEVPNGLDSIVTSICKPIFPALLYFQFRYLYNFRPSLITSTEQEELFINERRRAREDSESRWKYEKQEGFYGTGLHEVQQAF